MYNELYPIFIDFLSFLETLPFRFQYALIGGVTMSVWSEDRFTKDIDLTVILKETEWPIFEEFLKKSKDIIIDKTAFDSGSPVPYLIRIHFKGRSIDLLLALTDYQEGLIGRAITKEIMGHQLNIASPEDIIVSKLIAGRGQDMVDAEKIVKTISDLDIAYIEKWVKVWEVADRWEKIFQPS